MEYTKECEYIFTEGQRLLPHDFDDKLLESERKRHFVGLTYNCPSKECYDDSDSAWRAIGGPVRSDLFVIYLISLPIDDEEIWVYYAGYPTKKYLILKSLGG